MSQEILQNDDVNKIFQDIESIKIQGATNVALATLEGMRLALVGVEDEEEIMNRIESVGFRLSRARENEPLARNAVQFVLSQIKSHSLSRKDQILAAIDGFENLIVDAKRKIKSHAAEILKDYRVILTHCHSSTATSSLIEVAKMRKGDEFKVVSTETRPLFQGRKTAKELLDAGVDVTQIVDSASASFIVDDRYLPVETVVIGADEVYKDGSTINKVGSYQIALAASEGKDEMYVLTTLLKVDPTLNSSTPNIEMRPSREVWENAPHNLNIISPAFEIVPPELITGFITEAGLLKANELETAQHKYYPWL